MVSYDITIHRSAKRELQTLEDSDRSRLTDAIADVAREKQPTHHEKARILEGQSGLFRVRVGDMRAVCELCKPSLQVLSVGYRDNVYDCIDSINERRASV
jgi:mRNA-degrading endonuclease RelE of RelBE toxin-antitoxin system